MSMNLTVYVGPYLVVPKSFDWDAWDSLVCDGRMESGVDDENAYLVPSQAIGARQMSFDRHSEDPVLYLDVIPILNEIEVFRKRVEPVTDAAPPGSWEIRWGVVCGWG